MWPASQLLSYPQRDFCRTAVGGGQKRIKGEYDSAPEGNPKSKFSLGKAREGEAGQLAAWSEPEGLSDSCKQKDGYRKVSRSAKLKLGSVSDSEQVLGAGGGICGHLRSRPFSWLADGKLPSVLFNLAASEEVAAGGEWWITPGFADPRTSKIHPLPLLSVSQQAEDQVSASGLGLIWPKPRSAKSRGKDKAGLVRTSSGSKWKVRRRMGALPIEDEKESISKKPWLQYKTADTANSDLLSTNSRFLDAQETLTKVRVRSTGAAEMATNEPVPSDSLERQESTSSIADETSGPSPADSDLVPQFHLPRITPAASATSLQYNLPPPPSEFHPGASLSLLESQPSFTTLDVGQAEKKTGASEASHSPWTAIAIGPAGSLRWRMLFWGEGKDGLGGGSMVSPWHDVPLYGQDGLLNCVCKTPAGTWLRFESTKDEDLTPLRICRREEESSWKVIAGDAPGPEQGGGGRAADDVAGDVAGANQKDEFQKPWLVVDFDEQEGATSAPYSFVKPDLYAENSPWNVGMLPQTWADPEQLDEEFDGIPFDSCPLEVIDIGRYTSRSTGEIYPVKPLGAFAVVERSMHLAWKIVAIAADDPMAEMLQDVTDMDARLPGSLELIREWLRTCLCREPGDGESSFQLNECAADLHAAIGVVAETHAAWQLYADQLPPVYTPGFKGLSQSYLPPSDPGLQEGGSLLLDPTISNSPPTKESLELAWNRYIANESPMAVPRSGSQAHSNSSLYNRAWADLGESMSPSGEGRSSILSPRGDVAGWGKRAGRRGSGSCSPSDLLENDTPPAARSPGQGGRRSLRSEMFSFWKPTKRFLTHPVYYASPSPRLKSQQKAFGGVKGSPKTRDTKIPKPATAVNSSKALPGIPRTRSWGFRKVRSESLSREGFGKITAGFDVEGGQASAVSEADKIRAGKSAARESERLVQNHAEAGEDHSAHKVSGSSQGTELGTNKESRMGDLNATGEKQEKTKEGLADMAGHQVAEESQCPGGSARRMPGGASASAADDVAAHFQSWPCGATALDGSHKLSSGVPASGSEGMEVSFGEVVPETGATWRKDEGQEGQKEATPTEVDMGEGVSAEEPLDEELYPVHGFASSFSDAGSPVDQSHVPALPVSDSDEESGRPLSSASEANLAEDLYPQTAPSDSSRHGEASSDQIRQDVPRAAISFTLARTTSDPLSPTLSYSAHACLGELSSDVSFVESSDACGHDDDSSSRIRQPLRRPQRKVMGGPKKLTAIPPDVLIDSTVDPDARQHSTDLPSQGSASSEGCSSPSLVVYLKNGRKTTALLKAGHLPVAHSSQLAGLSVGATWPVLEVAKMAPLGPSSWNRGSWGGRSDTQQMETSAAERSQGQEHMPPGMPGGGLDSDSDIPVASIVPGGILGKETWSPEVGGRHKNKIRKRSPRTSRVSWSETVEVMVFESA